MEMQTDEEKAAEVRRTRRGRIPLKEKLAYIDRQIKWAEGKVAKFKAERAELVEQVKAQAAAMLKEVG